MMIMSQNIGIFAELPNSIAVAVVVLLNKDHK